MGARTFRVPGDARGERVDVWLAAQPGAGTRAQIKRAATEGRLRDGRGEAVRASYRLRGDETLLLDVVPASGDDDPQPEDIALDVLYADDDLVAVNKPPGLVVHPAAGHPRGTLLNALLHRFPADSPDSAPARAGIVHRLDRDTSGVILVARNVAAHESLARQFRERSIDKRYLALVRGVVREPGRIELPIGRHPRDRQRMSTAARRARSARTDYRPLETFAGVATLVEAKPETGRTHQIRVHLAARGWPVVADATYGKGLREGARLARRAPAHAREAHAALVTLRRQALHAASIRVRHPKTEAAMEFEAPLPDDLSRVLERLRSVCGHGEGSPNPVDSRPGID